MDSKGVREIGFGLRGGFTRRYMVPLLGRVDLEYRADVIWHVSEEWSGMRSGGLLRRNDQV
jgi:hypothetical protein